jgi:putative FmdB family regulatory protein
MPTYEYVCDQGHRFDVIHGLHDAGPTECPVCHSTNVRKAFAAPAIHFKGSGWAKKDRKATSTSPSSTKSDGGEAAASAKPASQDAGGKPDAAKSNSADSTTSGSGGSAATTSSSSSD